MTQQDVRTVPGGPPPAARASNGMAVAALVLGILACALFWTVAGGIVLGLLGLVFGVLGARRARWGRAPHRVMAVSGAALGGLALLASSVILAVGISIFNSDDFDNYRDCYDHADTKAQRDQCAEDFERDLDN